MIAHTRQFPTIPNTTNMESIVVIATPADPDMMEYHRIWKKTNQQFVNEPLSRGKRQGKEILLWSTNEIYVMKLWIIGRRSHSFCWLSLQGIWAILQWQKKQKFLQLPIVSASVMSWCVFIFLYFGGVFNKKKLFYSRLLDMGWL